MRARTVVIIVLLMLSLTLVAQNTQVVSFKLWFWDLTMSRVLLLAGSMAVGVIIGLLLGRPWKRRKKEVIRRAETPSAKPKTGDAQKNDS